MLTVTGIFIFFVVMTVAEGGGRRAVKNKLREMWFPTLKTSYLIWPAVQIVNFRLMPIQLQLVSYPLSPLLGCSLWFPAVMRAPVLTYIAIRVVR